MAKAHTGHHGQSGVQNHSAGTYFPVTIVTRTASTASKPAPVRHYACWAGLESAAFESFTNCEQYAVAIARYIKEGDHDAAKLLLNLGIK